MESDDVLVRHGCKGGFQLLIQRRQARHIIRAVLLNLRFVLRHGADKPVCQIVHHLDGILRIKPDMGVRFARVVMPVVVGVFLRVVMVMVVHILVHAVLGQQRDAGGRIHHGQLRKRVHHAGEVAFHARAVDEKYIRLVQHLHIAGGKLIIMQTAGVRRGEVADGDAVDALREVEGEEVDGIERRDDGFRRREGGGEEDEQRQKGCKQLFGFHVMMIPS